MIGRAWLAAAVLGISMILCAGSVVLLFVSSEVDFGTVAWLSAQAAFAIVGGLIGVRRPGNRIGWILLGGAFLVLVQSTCWHYANLALEPAGRDLPWLTGAAWLAGWTFVPGFVMFMVFLPLFFPNGRLLSARWRSLAWFFAALTTITTLAFALKPGPLEDLPINNPIGFEPAAELFEFIYLWGFPLVGVFGLIASSSLIVRFRRSSGVERQQLKWFGTATLVFLVYVVVSGLGDALNLFEISLLWELAGLATLLLMPVSIALAILRYRLYDIDRLISRTLAYAVLTAILAGGYLAAVLALQSILPLAEDSPVIVAASTLAVVVAFGPLRTRIQSAVDRRFNRSRYDSARTLADFGDRLRSQVEIEALQVDLIAAVDRTLSPAHISLWVAPTYSGEVPR